VSVSASGVSMSDTIKISSNCILKLDGFHFALLALIVLLAVYVARGYGLFRKGMKTVMKNGFVCSKPDPALCCNQWKTGF